MSDTTTRAHLSPYIGDTWEVEIRAAVWDEDEGFWGTDWEADPIETIVTDVPNAHSEVGAAQAAAIRDMLAAGWKVQDSDEGNDRWSADSTTLFLFVERTDGGETGRRPELGKYPAVLVEACFNNGYEVRLYFREQPNRTVSMGFTPETARALAQDILQAADDVEGLDRLTRR